MFWDISAALASNKQVMVEEKIAVHVVSPKHSHDTCTTKCFSHFLQLACQHGPFSDCIRVFFWHMPCQAHVLFIS
jgi:hypothetical protein